MRYSFVSTRFTFIQATLDVTLAQDDDKRIQARKCKMKDTLDITLAWDDDKRQQLANVKGMTNKVAKYFYSYKNETEVLLIN